MNKKIFSLIATLALLVAMMAVPVYAETILNEQLPIIDSTFDWDAVPTDTPINGQLPIDPVTGQAIYPIADGIDEGQFLPQPQAAETSTNTVDSTFDWDSAPDDTAINGQLPIDPVTGQAIYPIADGIDEGQFLPQPQAASHNYSSSNFNVGVFLKSGQLFNIQNTPNFTNVKQSTLADGSCKIAYQITNNSTNQTTSVVKNGAWVNTSTTVSGFASYIATGDCRVYLAGQDPTVDKKASGTFNY